MIICDLSDVMTGGTGAFRELLIARFGKEIALKVLALFTSGMLAQRNDMFRGQLSEADFFKEMAECIGDPEVTANELQRIFSAAVCKTLTGTFDVLKRISASPLKNGTKVSGCTIFIVADHVQEEIEGVLCAIRNTDPTMFKLINGYTMSFMMQKCKSDSGYFDDIYELYGEGLNEDIVYIDNLSSNISKAKRSGFVGVLFRGPRQLERSLKGRGFVFSPSANT